MWCHGSALREENNGRRREKQNCQMNSCSYITHTELKLPVKPVETCLLHMMRIQSHTFYILTHKLSSLTFNFLSH